MKEALKNNAAVLVALALAVLVVILLSDRCGRKAETGTVTVIRDTVPGDPYPVEVPVYVPKVRTELVPVEIPVGISGQVDTAAIISDYFTARYYVDTLRNDTSLLAVVADSVFGNRITARRFTYQNRRPIAVNTTIIQPPRKEPLLRVYAGAFAGYSPKTGRAAVGPELTVTMRPGPLLRYGYDIAGNGHQVSFGWKLSFGKKK